jgi:hypothetical protein
LAAEFLHLVAPPELPVFPFSLLQSWLSFALFLGRRETMGDVFRFSANCSDVHRLPIAAEILVKRNLLVWDGAIYCAQVARNITMVWLL